MINTVSNFNQTNINTLAELTKSDMHILNQTQTRKTINFDDDDDPNEDKKSFYGNIHIMNTTVGDEKYKSTTSLNTNMKSQRLLWKKRIESNYGEKNNDSQPVCETNNNVNQLVEAMGMSKLNFD